MVVVDECSEVGQHEHGVMTSYSRCESMRRVGYGHSGGPQRSLARMLTWCYPQASF
jgi:hypothetical protein